MTVERQLYYEQGEDLVHATNAVRRDPGLRSYYWEGGPALVLAHNLKEARKAVRAEMRMLQEGAGEDADDEDIGTVRPWK